MLSTTVNSLLVGVSLILSNIGSRYLLQDIANWKLEYLSHPLMRPVYLFSMAFASTRDFKVSVTVATIYLLLLGGDWFNISNQYGGMAISTTSDRNSKFECPKHHWNCPEDPPQNFSKNVNQWSLTCLNGLSGN